MFLQTVHYFTLPWINKWILFSFYVTELVVNPSHTDHAATVTILPLPLFFLFPVFWRCRLDLCSLVFEHQVSPFLLPLTGNSRELLDWCRSFVSKDDFYVEEHIQSTLATFGVLARSISSQSASPCGPGGLSHQGLFCPRCGAFCQADGWHQSPSPGPRVCQDHLLPEARSARYSG